MNELLEHLLHPLLDHPEDMQVNITEGDSLILIELSLHADDDQELRGSKQEHLQSVKRVLSIASGSRKATIELVGQSEDSTEASEEESSADDSVEESSSDEPQEATTEA
jgi:predicted RNA-binding protein YlqC (UPF0109 family)